MINDVRILEQRARAVSKTTLVGAVLNVALAAAKIVAGSISQSFGLIADGVHSLSDLVSDLLVWVAGRHAAQGPDSDHPYGHARYETAATFVLGGLLFAVAMGIAWDASKRLFDNTELLIPGPIALAVAVLSIVIKEWLYWWTLGYARRVRSELLRANAWHHRSDAISSIVVVIGIAGTMAGLRSLDAVAAVIVAIMIAKIAWELAKTAAAELVDTGLDFDQLDVLRQTIKAVDGVRGIHMLRTRKHAGHIVVDVHVLVDPSLSVTEGHMISLVVEQRLKRRIDDVTDVTVHIDPEDDETVRPSSGLPLREAVEETLDSLWANIPESAAREHMVLHYLAGKIDVDVYFPLPLCASDPQAAAELLEKLSMPLEKTAVFRRVRVFFGPQQGSQ
jgi:cation diffusion facilitator family transporter